MPSTIIFLIWFSYGLPSILLAILSFLTLRNSPHFQYPFYHLIKFDTVLNIIFYINYISSKIQSQESTRHLLADFLYEHPTLKVIRSTIIHLPHHIQPTTLILKFVLRYTMSRSITSLHFWSRHYKLVYMVSLLMSFLLNIPFVVLTCIYPPDKYPVGWLYISYYYISYSFIVCFSITILGALIIRNMKRHPFISTQVASFGRVLFCDWIVYFVCIVGFFVPTWLIPTDDFYIRATITQMMSDLMTLSGPWILYICDAKFRTEFWLILKDIFIRKQ